MTTGTRKKPSDEQVQTLIRAEEKRISALRMQLLESHPFWGFLLMQMRIIAEPNMPGIACTDCYRHIWLNPRFTQHLPISQLGFILCHEICHTVLATTDRCGGRNHERWNIATDYAINQIIADIPRPGSWANKKMYETPAGEIPEFGTVEPLLDEKYKGLIAESIYERLTPDQFPPTTIINIRLQLTGGDQSSPPGRAQSAADGQEGKGGASSQKTARGSTPGRSSSQKPSQGDASGSGGLTLEVSGVTVHKGAIDIHLPAGLKPQQREELAERIRDAIETWKKTGQRGHVPAGEVRHLMPSERSRVPWQRLLQMYAGQALARDDYSLARPNKRYLLDDLVVPGLYAEKMDHIVVALDTSGSMSEELLSKVASEIRKISDQADQTTLIIADAAVLEVIKSPQLEQFLRTGKAKGGGGTSHVPVFNYIEAKHLKPDLFIGMTDLETVFPDRKPSFPVLWLSPEDHGEAPWGKVIEVPGDS